jgi:hypothetical protein
MPQKTKLEILQETVAYYAADPVGRRAKLGAKCMYRTPEGRRCAVGRCMTKASVVAYAAYIGTVKNLVSTVLNGAYIGYDTVVRQPLKRNYQGHNLNFWDDLQALHDNNTYWTESGLSAEGQQFVAVLSERYREPQTIII